MITDNKYWDEMYSANKLDHQPSSFAQHVEDKYFCGGMSLLELGCGNGRDSLFFVEKGKQVQALDLSSKTIENLSSLNIKNVEFLNQDFSNLTKFRGVDYVYSRFTMHSVDEETEEKVFNQLSQVLKVGGLFLMEARSTKDEKLTKAFGEDHFRRYLNFQTTVKKLKHLNFRILEMQESQGLSPYKKEDPFLMRIVAQRL